MCILLASGRDSDERGPPETPAALEERPPGDPCGLCHSRDAGTG